jgi:hypothetical protein
MPRSSLVLLKHKAENKHIAVPVLWGGTAQFKMKQENASNVNLEDMHLPLSSACLCVQRISFLMHLHVLNARNQHLVFQLDQVLFLIVIGRMFLTKMENHFLNDSGASMVFWPAQDFCQS